MRIQISGIRRTVHVCCMQICMRHSSTNQVDGVDGDGEDATGFVGVAKRVPLRLRRRLLIEMGLFKLNWTSENKNKL